MAEIQTASYTIRHAEESDVPEILAMIKELAIYEKALHEVKATEESLLNTLTFPSNPNRGYAKTLLISPTDKSARGPVAKDIAGLALYFHNYSTWEAAPGIYLEDLFVRPDHRKKGYGKALIQALGRECVELKCKRLQWSVLDWNKPSIDFYVSEAIGAKPQTEWIGMRVDGAALEKLAESETM